MGNYKIFTDIYRENRWSCPETVSGWGSTLENTKVVVSAIEKIIDRYKIKTVLDIGCGDFNWQRRIKNLPYYTGIDIVDELIVQNRLHHCDPYRSFYCTSADSIPNIYRFFDLIICRDIFVHLPFAEVKQILREIKRTHKSGALILITTFVNRAQNYEIEIGGWRPLSMQKPPFNFPNADIWINEQYDVAAFDDKCLGLWRVEQIPDYDK